MSKTKLICIINGYPQTGKDTVAQRCIERLAGDTVCGGNLSSIGPVWQMLKDQGIDMDKKGPKERKLASDTKQALDAYDWYATRMAMTTANRMLDIQKSVWPKSVVFLHMREPDAIEFAKSICPEDTVFKTLLVQRGDPPKNISNLADAGVETMDYDFILDNHAGLEELNASCKHLCNWLVEALETE